MTQQTKRAAIRCERMPVSNKDGTQEIVRRMDSIIQHETGVVGLLDAAKHALQWFRDFDEPERCETEREWLEQAIAKAELTTT
ncbi:hypothetical protein LCGC14_2760520 [marine sediment metagenome]|uniref:Uncharacterized protein n=1 Tax=marine sediment metagenome TaxID=412755 RepID=A0A0F8YZ72_9ZZZZ